MENLSEFVRKYEPQINEARRSLFVCLVVFLVGGAGGLFFASRIIGWLMSFFDLSNVNVVLTTPYQFINLSIGLGVTLGFFMAIPVLLFYLIRFIKPALSDKEYEFAKRLVPISLGLFVAGNLFGIKIEQLVVVLYSQSSGPLKNYWDIESFLSQVVLMTLTMGMVFELPVVLTILMRLKVVSRKAIAKQRKLVYLGLTIFGVLLPPNDALSLILIITPLFILFESTLLFNRA